MESPLKQMSSPEVSEQTVDESDRSQMSSPEISEQAVDESDRSQMSSPEVSEQTVDESDRSQQMSSPEISEQTVDESDRSQQMSSPEVSEQTVDESDKSQGTQQLAKLGKVLLTVEKGTLSQCKGQALDDIEIDPEEISQIHLRRDNSKRKWDDTEVRAVERHMMDFIHTCKVPRKMDCLQCIRAEPDTLRDCNWTGVKNYVRNRITAMKKKACAKQ
ncbi:uncharacterized protein LOC115384904 isoform X3 [Salarias fasciatus]|uniref:uncharacterized protein LOC115384904 isoform X3 n=1 Tax=Salarias fasciatus TaxID=181472 RepID=UPI00117696AD|nr:uncharacterized protein LOC115384904 isoform X3 [Salarias fasciatus]